MASLRGSLAAAEAKNEALEAQVKELHEAFGNLQTEHGLRALEADDAQEALKEATDQITKQAAELKALAATKARAEAAEQRVLELNAAVAAMESQLENSAAPSEEVPPAKKGTEMSADDRSEEVRILREQYRKADDACSTAQRVIDEKEAKIREISSERDAARQAADKAEAERKALRARVRDLEKEFQDMLLKSKPAAPVAGSSVPAKSPAARRRTTRRSAAPQLTVNPSKKPSTPAPKSARSTRRSGLGSPKTPRGSRPSTARAVTGLASPMTPREPIKKQRTNNGSAAARRRPIRAKSEGAIPAPVDAVGASGSAPLATPAKTPAPLPRLDKAGARALKAEFMRHAETMKEVEKDSDWQQRMKAMKALRVMIVDQRLTERKMWDSTLRKVFKSIMSIQIADLRSSIIKEACGLLVATADAMGPRFTSLFKYFVPRLMKLLYVTIRIISETAYSTMRAMFARLLLPDLFPVLFKIAEKDTHAQCRHRAIEFTLQLVKALPVAAVLPHRAHLSTVMCKCLSDADTKARAESRALFAHYESVWPDDAAALFAEMAPETQRAIKRMAKEAASGRSTSRKRKKGFKKSRGAMATWSAGMMAAATQS